LPYSLREEIAEPSPCRGSAATIQLDETGAGWLELWGWSLEEARRSGGVTVRSGASGPERDGEGAVLHGKQCGREAVQAPDGGSGHTSRKPERGRTRIRRAHGPS